MLRGPGTVTPGETQGRATVRKDPSPPRPRRRSDGPWRLPRCTLRGRREGCNGASDIPAGGAGCPGPAPFVAAPADALAASDIAAGSDPCAPAPTDPVAFYAAPLAACDIAAGGAGGPGQALVTGPVTSLVARDIAAEAMDPVSIPAAPLAAGDIAAAATDPVAAT
jgi:hypothetical protein